MMENTIKHINIFPNHQFFFVVGIRHIDTYGDSIKENDRFSIFFNRNKISYFSFLQMPPTSEKEELLEKSKAKFYDLIDKARNVEPYRKKFCEFYNCKDDLFFRLAKER